VKHRAGAGLKRRSRDLCRIPLRAGSFDKFLNVQITLIIVLQIVMCALHGSLALWWRNQHADNRYYLATTIQGQVRPAMWARRHPTGKTHHRTTTMQE